jgi:hypothetical protein
MISLISELSRNGRKCVVCCEENSRAAKGHVRDNLAGPPKVERIHVKQELLLRSRVLELGFLHYNTQLQ